MFVTVQILECRAETPVKENESTRDAIERRLEAEKLMMGDLVFKALQMRGCMSALTNVIYNIDRIDKGKMVHEEEDGKSKWYWGALMRVTILKTCETIDESTERNE